MATHPLAGQLAPESILVDVSKLHATYSAEKPDPTIREQRVAFGDLRVLLEFRHQARQRQRAFRFVAVNGGEDADADGVTVQFRLERSATIAAPPALVFPLLNDFHRWEGWSPWAKLDPNMKKALEGSPEGVGAVKPGDALTGGIAGLGTLQVDFVLPELLGAEYVAEDNERRRPVINASSSGSFFCSGSTFR